jgi:hypothetical protein
VALSAYDPMYVSLAEAIEATIVTCDSPLAKHGDGALGCWFAFLGSSWTPWI